MSNIEVGTMHTMEVTRSTVKGYEVTKRNETAKLAIEDLTEEIAIGDLIDVFVYHDKEDKLNATMNVPEVTTDSFGWAKVIQIVPHLGAFVNFGLPNEVLVPHDALPAYRSVWPKHGDELYITLTHDRRGRMLAKLASEFTFDGLYDFGGDTPVNTVVEGKIIRVDREGSVLITTDNLRGFIHNTEMDREPRIGQFVEGRVIEAKEDGSINVSLLPLKHERIDTDADKITAYIEEAGGSMSFTDKSDADQIRSTFHMSKSSFKRALGRLMKNRLIKQEDGKTILLEPKVEETEDIKA